MLQRRFMCWRRMVAGWSYMGKLGRRCLAGNSRESNCRFHFVINWKSDEHTFERFGDWCVKHPHLYSTGKYLIKSPKCILSHNLESVLNWILGSFLISRHNIKPDQLDSTIFETCRPFRGCFASHNDYFF